MTFFAFTPAAAATTAAAAAVVVVVVVVVEVVSEVRREVFFDGERHAANTRTTSASAAAAAAASSSASSSFCSELLVPSHFTALPPLLPSAPAAERFLQAPHPPSPIFEVAAIAQVEAHGEGRVDAPKSRGSDGRRRERRRR